MLPDLQLRANQLKCIILNDINDRLASASIRAKTGCRLCHFTLYIMLKRNIYDFFLLFCSCSRAVD